MIFKISYLKIIQAFLKIYFYEKQHKNRKNKQISRINWYKKVIYMQKFQNPKQANIKNFLNR